VASYPCMNIVCACMYLQVNILMMRVHARTHADTHTQLYT